MAFACVDTAVAQAALEKSYEKSVFTLAESLSNMIPIRHQAKRVPFVGKPLEALDRKLRGLISALFACVPIAGPALVKAFQFIEDRIKVWIFGKVLLTVLRMSQFPLEKVASIVRAMA